MHIYSSPMVDLLEFMMCRFCVVFQCIIHIIYAETYNITIRKFVYSCLTPILCAEFDIYADF